MEDPRRELKRLGSVLVRLERRISTLERQRGAQASATARPDPRSPERPTAPVDEAGSDRAFALLFTRLAAGSFVLLGALALRVATQQGRVPARLGVGLGLVYCALLLAAPLAARRPAVVEQRPILEHFGALLAPLVVVETFHRQPVMPLAVAAVLLVAVGAGTALFGVLRRRPSLAAIGLVGPVVALPALGLEGGGLLLRAALLAVLAALGLLVAARSAWSFLRPLVLVPIGVALGLVVLLTAQAMDLDPAVGRRLLVPVLLVWAAVIADLVRREERVSAAGSAWLPVASVWAFLLAWFALGWTGLILGAAGALASLALASLRRRSPILPAWLATAALLGLVAFPACDRSGLLLAALALGLLRAERSGRRPLVLVLSALLAVAAAATALSAGGLVRLEGIPALAPRTAAGALLFTLLLLVARRLGGARLTGDGSALRGLLAAVALLAAIAAACATLRAGAFLLLGKGEPLQLAESVLIAALAVLGLVLARRFTVPLLRRLGFVGIGLLALKVLLFDLFTLKGALLLGAAIVLAVAFVAASIAIRRGAVKAQA